MNLEIYINALCQPNKVNLRVRCQWQQLTFPGVGISHLPEDFRLNVVLLLERTSLKRKATSYEIKLLNVRPRKHEGPNHRGNVLQSQVFRRANSQWGRKPTGHPTRTCYPAPTRRQMKPWYFFSKIMHQKHAWHCLHTTNVKFHMSPTKVNKVIQR